MLFVRAGASPGGDGSRRAPFDSLAAVAKASLPGEEIVVLPAPLSVPPLDGGITLKPRQSLVGAGGPIAAAGARGWAPRITNHDPRSNSGDAVVLADGAEVRNLVITGSFRGGIHGADVSGVKIVGNDLSATNTSCTAGLYVYFPGDLPVLANGWAAIMIDEDRGSARLSIDHNRIHDGSCADGIDIRASGRARVRARIDGNELTRLAQGPGMRSVLAIGMQTRGRALLAVDSDDDTETDIGSANADCEGLFANQTGGSLTWRIERNRFAHGIGGESCNGVELFTDTGITRTSVYIGHSSFADDPGDMIEEDDGGGAGSVMKLTLADVSVSHTSFPSRLRREPKFTDIQYMDNLGRCMDQYSWGHGNVNDLRIVHSVFSDCDGDGVGSDVTGGTYRFESSTAGGGKRPGAIDFGDGKGDSVAIDIESSAIENSGQYVLHFADHAAMASLEVRVRNSRLSGARGAAVVAFDQDGTTRHAHIDLGGRGDAGRNCIIGGAQLAAETTGYTVLARSNWWGGPHGPPPQRIAATAGQLRIRPVADSPPGSCALGR